MSDPPRGGRGVFIGNIPYGLTEDEIVRILSSIGPVDNFRLVYDPDTGRPKGFGFAEYKDADSAQSAVRNLDKYNINGRELRVDYSHIGAKDDVAAPGPAPIQNTKPEVNPIVGALPMGAELPAGLTCPDAISKTLSTLPPAQLLDILSQMKALVMSDPGRAAELLKQAPQLAYAMFQALLLMGLVDANLIATVVEQSAPVAAAPPPATQFPPAQAPLPPRPYMQAPPPMQYGAPPVPPQYQAPPPQQPVFPPGQEQLIRQLLAMPQIEIDRLGPNERGQIMALKQQYGGML